MGYIGDRYRAGLLMAYLVDNRLTLTHELRLPLPSCTMTYVVGGRGSMGKGMTMYDVCKIG